MDISTPTASHQMPATLEEESLTSDQTDNPCGLQGTAAVTLENLGTSEAAVSRDSRPEDSHNAQVHLLHGR